MTKSVSLLTLLAATLWSLSVAALIPPLSEDDLEKDADLIVVAKVIEVTAVGKVKEDHCYGWQTYQARVLLEKTVKGQAEGKEIVVRYRSRVKNVKRCVGGANSYHLSKDSRYKLYLQRATDKKTKKITYHFYHWQCVASE